jgi:phosphoglycolate phosphatase
MSNEPLRLVIFDLDGTLVDSAGGIHRCISKTLERHELPPVTYEFVLGGIGLGLAEAWARIAPDADDKMVAALTETYREVFLAARAAGEEQDPLFPGAKEALADLDAAGHLMGIATNKGRPGVSHVLDLHGIGGHFVAIRSAHDGPAKPHPDAILDVLAKTGAEARHTVFVGDTETDMITAQNAGVAALGVGWGYHPPNRLLGLGAKAVAQDFAEVPELVSRIIGP